MITPVLVTGLGRTGTTWVGRMLCLSGELNYIHEPFCFHRFPERWPAKLPNDSFYICSDNEADCYPIVADVVRMKYPVLNRLSEIYRQPNKIERTAYFTSQYVRSLRARARHTAPLLKDPRIFFAAPWLARRFNVRVVITIRHPAGVVSSMKRLGWRVDFRRWRDQPLLMRDYLGPFAAEIEEQCRQPQDVISQATLLWNMYYSVALKFKEENPSWLFLKHEELAADPSGRFRKVYQQLNLTWDDSVGRTIQEYTKAGNPPEGSPKEIWTVKRDSKATTRIWQERLTRDELRRIRDSVEAISKSYYSDGDW